MTGTWRVVLSTLGFAVPVTVTVLDVFGYVAKVEGASMQPTLNPGPDLRKADYVLLNRWAARTYDLERGEVVSLACPSNPDQKLIKRVIGLQGDTIKTLHYKNLYVKVPEGHVWIEGDNHGHSLDSNHFGPVALGLVSAKATRVVWPPSRWQKLPIQSPPNARINNSRFDGVPAHIRQRMERELSGKTQQDTYELDSDLIDKDNTTSESDSTKRNQTMQNSVELSSIENLAHSPSDR